MEDTHQLEDLEVDGNRLRQSLEQMAGIGATSGGGVQRLALSDEDKRARDLLVDWLEELELEVTVDAMGNIFGRRAGCQDDLAPVMSGSHLDSQPRGGRFDGALGVLGMLEVMRTLRDHEVETRRPVVIVDWTNEEGSRFSPAMVASGVWAGALDLQWAYHRSDIDGKKLGDELERIGYRGEAPCQNFPVHAYYEYHIEQGPHLVREGKVIGAPQGIVCLQWYDVYLKGEANQVGPTPMEGRRDALCAAAEMILEVEALPREMGGDLVATVGEIQNEPNSRNIIPGDVHFTVDIRSWEDELARRAWGVLERTFLALSERRGCSIEIEETWSVARSSFDPTLVQRVLGTADALGYPSLKMVSGAGHDASYVNRVCPSAMIFVPSIGGRSHVEVEQTRWQDCEAGANVLLHCVLESAAEGRASASGSSNSRLRDKR
jgi:N-carbamoyl-L-amino-acid hydrolase